MPRSLAELEARRDAIAERRAELFAQKAPIDEELTRLYEEKETIEDQIGQLHLDAMDGVDWPLMLRANGHGGGMTLYKRAQKEFEKIGLYMSGYWPDTGDTASKIVFRRCDEAQYELIKAGITTLAPFMTPQEDGFLYFGIIDNSLSADGTYRLHVRPDLSVAEVHLTFYGRSSVLRSGTFEQALRFVQSDLWCNDHDD